MPREKFQGTGSGDPRTVLEVDGLNVFEIYNELRLSWEMGHVVCFHLMQPGKTRWIVRRIIPCGVTWLLFSLVFLFIEYAAIEEAVGSSEIAIAITLPVLVFACSAINIIELLVGTMEVLYLEKKFAGITFLRKVVYKVLI